MKRSALSILFSLVLSGCLAFSGNADLPTPSLPFLPGGHTKPVIRIVFSPSGEFFATSSFDRVVKVWDSQTWNVVADLWGHTRPVYGLAFSPDGRTLVSSGADKSIRIWNWGDSKSERVINVAGVTTNCLLFGPGGKVLFSGGGDGQVGVWAYPEMVLQQSLGEHMNPIYALRMSPDQQYIIAVGGKRITVWKCSDLPMVRQWDLPAGGVDACLSPDGCTLAVALDNNDVQIYRFPDGEILQVFKGHTRVAKAVAFSPDGLSLASVSWDGSLRIWDMGLGKETVVLAPPDKQEILSVAWDPYNSHRVLTGGWDNQVRIWDVEKKVEVGALSAETSPLFGIAVNREQTKLVCGSQQTGLQIWDLHLDPLPHVHINTVSEYREPIYSVAFHPNQPLLAHTTADGEVFIWDVEQGKLIRRIILKGHLKSPVLMGIDFSLDGKVLAVCGGKEVLLLDADSGAILCRYESHVRRNRSIVFSPNGERLATVHGHFIKLWRTRQDERFGPLDKTLTGHESEVMAIDFSPDGTYLSSVDIAGAVKIWNPYKGPEGTELASWQLKDGEKALKGQIIAYDPGGSYVVAGSQSGEIVIFHLLQLKPVRIVKAHRDFVAGFAFSADGTKLFSTGGDHLLRAWEFPEMKPLFTAVATKEGKESIVKDL